MKLQQLEIGEVYIDDYQYKWKYLGIKNDCYRFVEVTLNDKTGDWKEIGKVVEIPLSELETSAQFSSLERY